MGQDRTLARGGRIPGALVLAVLALLSLGWIIWDFVEANNVIDVWKLWQGSLPRASGGQWSTSWIEPMLVVVYAVCSVTAARSSSAAGILCSAGVLTVVLRLPGLWTLNADWLKSQDGGLKSAALFTVVAALVLGLGLIVIAAVGRRPVGPAGGQAAYEAGPGGGPPYPQGGPPGVAEAHGPVEYGPAHPVRGGAILAFAALVLLSFLRAAWEISFLMEADWEVYSRYFLGDQALVALLAVPGGWYAWATVLLMLTAAFAALADKPFSRPLGMTIAATQLATGFTTLTYSLGFLSAFFDLETGFQLSTLSALLQFAGGIVVIAALARRDDGESYYDPVHPAGQVPGWGAGPPRSDVPGMAGPVPGHGPPPGWGSPPPGWGPPPPGPGPAPYYAPPGAVAPPPGPPAGGGFGPPPESPGPRAAPPPPSAPPTNS